MKYFWLLLMVCADGWCKSKIDIAFRESPPYRVMSETGQAEGMDVEIFDIIGAQIGLEMNYVVCPMARCLELAKTGEIDLIPGILKTEERQTYITFIEPPYYTVATSYSFYVRRESGISIKRYEDLHDLRISTLRGSTHFDRFDADSSLFKVEMPDSVTQVNMLAEGRVDAMIVVDAAVDSLLKVLVKDQLLVKAEFEQTHYIEGYMAISKKSEHHNKTEEISKAIKNAIESGKLEEIFNKYNAL